MSKVKLKPVKLRCRQGEVYLFIGGWAEVPGFYVGGKPVKISLQEFKELRES